MTHSGWVKRQGSPLAWNCCFSAINPALHPCHDPIDHLPNRPPNSPIIPSVSAILRWRHYGHACMMAMSPELRENVSRDAKASFGSGQINDLLFIYRAHGPTTNFAHKMGSQATLPESRPVDIYAVFFRFDVAMGALPHSWTSFPWTPFLIEYSLQYF